MRVLVVRRVVCATIGLAFEHAVGVWLHGDDAASPGKELLFEVVGDVAVGWTFAGKLLICPRAHDGRVCGKHLFEVGEDVCLFVCGQRIESCHIKIE